MVKLVSELIKEADYEKVWDELYKGYYLDREDVPEERLPEIKEQYRTFLKKLCEITPKPEEGQYLCLTYYYDCLEEGFSEAEADKYMLADVCLYDAPNDEIYSMSFIDWDLVMGWIVPEYVQKKYSVENITAHLLWEISFFGFDEDEMKHEKHLLEEAVEEAKKIKDMPPEEAEKRLRPFSDLAIEPGCLEEDEIIASVKKSREYNVELFKKYGEINSAITEEYKNAVKQERQVN